MREVRIWRREAVVRRVGCEVGVRVSSSGGRGRGREGVM